LITWLPRLAAIVNTVTSPVTTTHSHCVRPACGQRVSSALATGACGRVACAAATGAASAAAVAWHNPSTLLAARGTPNTVPHTSATWRRLSR
jgi:hypothetical protein